jgi:hypothetical protein
MATLEPQTGHLGGVSNLSGLRSHFNSYLRRPSLTPGAHQRRRWEGGNR